MKKVTIYTIPGCSYCTKALAFMDEKNISYEEISVPISKSERSILDEFAKYFPGDERGVPVIVIQDDKGKRHYFDDETDPEFLEIIKE